MATGTNQVRDQLYSLFTRLNPRQKFMLFGSLVVGLAVLIVVLFWTAGTNYEVLFSNLSPQDAGKIVEKLKEKKIDYQLEGGGNTILVPTDKVYDLRLQFAQEGLPESSSVGYEIFDKTNLGMTDFIQQINYRRALEGELSRTIEQIDAVSRAKVHIVIPKEALFKEDEKKPTASVILKLKRSAAPPRETVQAISHLIASSVEGLAPESVTIVDTRGRILSQNENPDDMAGLSATQLEFSQKVENYFTRKLQSMLDQVIGPGNSVVRVTADLNFTRVEKSVEQYDPENASVRSEEIQEESTPVGGGSNTAQAGTTSPASKRSSTVTNYELNKTVQHIVEGVGNIKHLSVAVMVNNKRIVKTDKDGKKTITYVPRSPAEIQTLTRLVQTAVGYQPNRKDQVSVVNVDFTLPNQEDDLFNEDKPGLWDNWYDLIEKVFLVLAIVVSILIMRSLFSQVRQRHEIIQQKMKELERLSSVARLPRPRGAEGSIGGAGEAAQLTASPSETDQDTVLQAEDFFKMVGKQDQSIANLHNFIKQNPQEAARLLKVWLLEDEENGVD